MTRAKAGNRGSVAALAAVKEGNDLWLGRHKTVSYSYQRAVDPRQFEKAAEAFGQAVRLAMFNLGVVCLARKNLDCALSQYNRLKLTDDPLAKAHYDKLHGDRVLDVSQMKK